MTQKSNELTIDNRKAYHEYFIQDKFEAGIALKGSEVKSIRDGRANLAEAFVRAMNGEVYLVNLHISTYKFTYDLIPDSTRTRKLLLKKSEINRLLGQLSRKGLACIPLRMYFKRGFVKVEIALALKKKMHDKREVIKNKIQKREIDKAVKNHIRRGKN